MIQISLKNETATQQFAEDLALCLKPGDLITLSGDLGAGKTTLTRALIRALANDAELEVPSPTFTLVQEYQETRIPLAHADIYRLEFEEEIEELGFDEFLEAGAILVEWPEKAPSLFDRAIFQLKLEETDDNARLLTLDSPSKEAKNRLEHSLNIRLFLQQHDRGMAKRRFLQGDASSRAYEKLYFSTNFIKQKQNIKENIANNTALHAQNSTPKADINKAQTLASAMPPVPAQDQNATPPQDLGKTKGHNKAEAFSHENASNNIINLYNQQTQPSNNAAFSTNEAEYSEILMDAPDHEIHDITRRAYIEKTHLAQNTRQFSDIAKLLYNNGFKAPKIFAENSAQTLLLIEDLGSEGIINSDKTPIKKRYIACAECLAKFHEVDWQKAAKAENCTLANYDITALRTEANLLPEWYYSFKTGKQPQDTWLKEYERLWQELLVKLQEDEQTLVMRDFHSPNILWQKAEHGVKHIGLIDFQDAVFGAPAYDLASLAQDARVDMSQDLENTVKEAYLTTRKALGSAFNADIMAQSYAILGAQRASKILGIFVRLNVRDGKPVYLQHLPRIETYLKRNLQSKIMQPLHNFFQESGLL